MDIFEMDKQGNPVKPGFSFLGQVRENAIKVGKERPLQIGEHVIPRFDPFHDHLTSLIVNDIRVKIKMGNLFAEEMLNGLVDYRKAFRLDKFKIDMSKAEAIGLGRGLSSIDVWLPPFDDPYKAISVEIIQKAIDNNKEK